MKTGREQYRNKNYNIAPFAGLEMTLAGTSEVEKEHSPPAGVAFATSRPAGLAPPGPLRNGAGSWEAPRGGEGSGQDLLVNDTHV